MWLRPIDLILQVTYVSTRKRSMWLRTHSMVSSSPDSSEYRGFQPQRLLGQRGTREQSLDLAFRRPMALLLGADRDRPAQPPADQLDQLANGNILATADVDDLAQRCDRSLRSR